MKWIVYSLMSYFIFGFTFQTIAQKKQSKNETVFESKTDNKKKTYFKAKADNIVKADNPKRKKKIEKIVGIDSIVTDFLGKERTIILTTLDKIEAYELETFISRDSTAKKQEGFKILRSNVLSPKQIKHIEALLTNKATYAKHNKYKQCLFLPKMGLKVTDTTGKSMNVLLSYECNMIRFYLNKTPKILNSDVGYDKLYAFYKEVFPPEMKKMEVKIKALSPVFYTVEKGDNLTEIAKMASNTYNCKITASDLKEWNKLKKPDIYPDNQLIINYIEN